MTDRISGLEEAIAVALPPNESEWGEYGNVEALIEGLQVGSVFNNRALRVEGILAGLPFVFVFRASSAVLKLGPLELPLYQASMKVRAEKDSSLTPDEFSMVFVKLVKDLARAPYPYEFEGKTVTLRGTLENLSLEASEEPALFRSWGLSPESAYEDLTRPSEELERVGLSKEVQAEIFALQEVKPNPITRDLRIFPSPEPVFATLVKD